jgi:predicted deacylase
MRPPEFREEALAPGTRRRFALTVASLPDGNDLWLPVLAVCGRRPGPSLALLAGVHGDEYEGIRAVPEALRALDPEILCGRVAAVPVCNVPAFREARRCGPADGLNLARVFPGDPRGTVTERIAARLTEAVIARADLLIDLHSAGIAYSMPLLVGYAHEETPLGRASREVALAFGCDVVWGHPPDPEAAGRSVSAAAALGVPWIYTEAPGGARARAQDVAAFAAGVLNVMRHLGMLPGPLERREPRLNLFGSGNLDRPIRAGASGYFAAEVELLQEVRAGQLLGRILDLFGETLEEIRADRDGRVVMTRGLPVIHAGEGAFLLTGTLARPSG